MRRGADYLAGIRRDGRTILLDGVAVEDVTAHPGFA
jgi:aromatic ring hydroxylase